MYKPRYMPHAGQHRPITDPLDALGYYAFETGRMVYPLSALCRCGEIITRKSATGEWTVQS